MRKRKFFVHRTDVNDFSRAFSLPEMTHHCLRHKKKHTLQIDVQNIIKILLRHVPEVSEASGSARPDCKKDHPPRVPVV